MISLNTIFSVARYERILLSRSWFFRIFALLSVIPIGLNSYFSLEATVNVALPSSLPYMNLLMLNVGQAVIAIFLASEFIKRDQKLDTSEVFFVKPMSNLEYVAGKTLGSIQMFMLLNVVVVIMTYIFNRSLDWVDYMAYVYYIALITLPTLIFIIGLSYFMMVVIRNQAIVFALLLGYVAMTVFYVGDSIYYVFDYMGFSLPLMISDIVGMTNMETIVNHRLSYMFIGLGLISMTVYKLNRLPNRRVGRYYVLAFSIMLLVVGFGGIYAHINGFYTKASQREAFLALNNKYSASDKLLTESYDIKVAHKGSTIHSTVSVKGKTTKETGELIFTLNPGMKIEDVKCEEYAVNFVREGQIIRVIPGSVLPAGTVMNIYFRYSGGIDQTFCYLDIEKEKLNENISVSMLNIDKQYAFLSPDYVLLTPETYWYPRPGTSYSDINSDWQQTYFSDYTLEVTTADSLKAVSQGERVFEEGSYKFKPEGRLLSMSLAIGNYKELTYRVDSVDYSAVFIAGHDNFSSILDSINDTIPAMIRDVVSTFQRQRGLGSYPFKRLSIVEVPVQFAAYDRMWSQTFEKAQPEMVFYEERGYKEGSIHSFYQGSQKWQKYARKKSSEEEMRIDAFNSFINIFTKTGKNDFSFGGGGKMKTTSTANPYNIFPNYLNYRVNIYSPQWLIGNRIIEQYIMPVTSPRRYRDWNGVATQESANMALREYSFRQLLGNDDYRSVKAEIINMKAKELFMIAEQNASEKEVKRELVRILDNHSFRNISFEEVLDSLGNRFDVDMKSCLSYWMDSVSLPVYETLEPVFLNYKNRDEDIYVTSVDIKNVSDYRGMLYFEVREGQKRNNHSYFYIEPHQTVRKVVYTENPPVELVINTNISGNIPYRFFFRPGKIETVRGVNPLSEGTHVIDEEKEDENVIIIDNEDEGFSVTDDKKVGYLAHWLNTDPKSETKYSGIQYWRPPLTWALGTNDKYYGKTIRSCAAVKSGDGTKFARWQTPIREEGRYDIYYYVSESDYLNHDKRSEAKYQFFIEAEGEAPEEVYVDMRKAKKGWWFIGTYYLDKGECAIKLTNKVGLRMIEADAVKFVKR